MNIPDPLRKVVAEFTAFLETPGSGEPQRYELIESRFDCVKFVTQQLNSSGNFTPDEVRAFQAWFHSETDQWLLHSPMISRARTWPEGYPGDYKTLEGVYANEPAGEGVGLHLDRYFLSRTLAVAIRSRRRRLAELLTARTAAESNAAIWLNLACGSCRELLDVPPPLSKRKIFCVDSDPNALSFAGALLANQPLGELVFRTENAYKFVNPERNATRYGQFSTIYSAGLLTTLPVIVSPHFWVLSINP